MAMYGPCLLEACLFGKRLLRDCVRVRVNA